jgi:hypothetical protein
MAELFDGVRQQDIIICIRKLEDALPLFSTFSGKDAIERQHELDEKYNHLKQTA